MTRRKKLIQGSGTCSASRRSGMFCRISRKLILPVLLILAGNSGAATFADLAVVLAKGSFRGYVDPEAPLEQCVAFLNRHGICFSLFDLMNMEKSVSKEDVARVFGQATLLFSGEATVVNGCIKKPLEAETWVDYCLLNDVDLIAILKRVDDLTSGGLLPEVKAFFKK